LLFDCHESEHFDANGKEAAVETRKFKHTRFKMFQAELLRDHDLAMTIKLGLAFYLAMAMMATPAAICSLQHQIPLPEKRWSVPQFHGPVPCPDSHVVSNPAEGGSLLKDFKEAIPVWQAPATPYDRFISKASQAYQVEAALIKAVIMAESGYNPRAVSHKGAQGLMQLMPTTAKWLGVHDSFDPALNIDGGVRYLRNLLDRFKGDVPLALAAYNAGSRYVRKYGGVPPFKATRIYIKKVMKYRKNYRNLSPASDGPRIVS
jgi:hypothetical protein